jgi:hypothetical protein
MFQGAFADLIQTGSGELMGVGTREALPNLSHQAASRPRGLTSTFDGARGSCAFSYGAVRLDRVLVDAGELGRTATTHATSAGLWQ